MLDLRAGDCVDLLRDIPSDSVDSIVTDPPYELGFMNKSWDNTGIAYQATLWKELLRVLKPGGHLLAFGGSRTYHRMACAIEDSGFEIRDQIMWVYSSGFPKSLNISKAIDKKLEIVPEVIGTIKTNTGLKGGNFTNGSARGVVDITVPSSELAKQWEGFGTALKPAHEPICVARKPLDGTTLNNVLTHGTGVLNIDECRIDGRERTNYELKNSKRTHGATYAALLPPPGGIVLDPFMGSGSTGKAALLEGFGFIACEKESEYFEIAKKRIAYVNPDELFTRQTA